MIYSIVFMQGDDYDEWYEVYDNHGLERAVEYLAQWDYGDNSEIHKEFAAGGSDYMHTVNHGDFQYVMSWNLRLGYVGLEKVVNVANEFNSPEV